MAVELVRSSIEAYSQHGQPAGLPLLACSRILWLTPANHIGANL
jgi:hypothetical protein